MAFSFGSSTNGSSNWESDSANANSSIPSRPMHQLEPFFYLPLSSINCCLSVLAFAHFLRRGRSVHPVLRRLLVAMSLFELLFHSCVIASYLPVAITGDSNQPGVQDTPAPMLALLCALRAALCMRNWTMCLISWSRVEAVFRPLSSRHGTAFRLTYLVIMETGIGIVAMTLSIAMVMALDPRLRIRHFTPRLARAVEITFYAFQGLLPIVSIFVATCITVRVLHRASSARRHMAVARRPRLPTDMRHCRRQSRREQQAIRIIVALSVSCLILESPTDLCGFVEDKKPETELIVNTLVELDSLFNFLLLACTTDFGRRLVCRGRECLINFCCWYRRRRWRRRPRLVHFSEPLSQDCEQQQQQQQQKQQQQKVSLVKAAGSSSSSSSNSSSKAQRLVKRCLLPPRCSLRCASQKLPSPQITTDEVVCLMYETCV